MANLLRQPAQHGAVIYSAENDVVTFDGSKVETPSDIAEVTQHPIEEGANIADHVQQQPTELAITGILSNTPIPTIGTELQPPDSAFTRYDRLVQMKENASLVDIFTGLRAYRNYVITEVTVTRDGKVSRNTVEVNVSFQEVKRVSALEVQVDPSIFAEEVRHSANPETDTGGPVDKSGLTREPVEVSAFEDVTNALGTLMDATMGRTIPGI